MSTKTLLTSSVLFVFLLFMAAGRCLADTSEQFEQARTYQQNGNYEQAEAIYLQIIADHPGSDDAFKAQKALVFLYITAGKEPQADTALQQLISVFYSHKDIAMTVCQVADRYRRSKRYDRAEGLYLNVIESWPRAEHALWSQMHLTIMYIKTNRLSDAQESYQQMLTRFSDRGYIANTVYQVADAYRSSGKKDRANEIYQYVVDNWPESRHAMWSQMRITISHVDRGQSQEADAGFAKLVADFSQQKRIEKAVVQVADAFGQSQKHERAREIYQFVADTWPKADHTIWALMHVIIYHINDWELAEAEADFQKLIADFSQHCYIANVSYQTADAYRKLKQIEEARQTYQYVVDNYPDAEHAIWSQMQITVLHIKNSESAEAEAGYQKLLANYSGRGRIAEAVYQVADAWWGAKQYEKARDVHRYVVDTWPNADYAMLSQKGVALANIALEDDPNSEAAIDKLLTKYSGDNRLAEAVHNMAYRCRGLRKYERANELDRYVLDKWPNSEHAVLAQMDIAMSDVNDRNNAAAESAIERLTTEFAQRKHTPQAIHMIAQGYHWSKKYEKARELYQYVIDTWPDHTEAMWAQMNMAKLYFDTGNEPNVMSALDKIIADFNDQPELAAAIFQVGEKYYNKALSYKKNKLVPKMIENFEKTIAVWERVITDLPISDAYTPRFYYITAVIYSQEMGEYLKGIEYYQKVVDNWPDYEFAWHAQFFVGMYYEKLRNSGVLPKSEANPKVEQAYKAVVEKYPDSESAPYAALKLGYLNFSRHKWPDAVHYFEMFVQEDDGQAPNFLLTNALYYLGQAYEQLNEFDKAIAIYSIFLQIVDPDDSRIKIVIAKLEKLEGENK